MERDRDDVTKELAIIKKRVSRVERYIALRRDIIKRVLFVGQDAESSEKPLAVLLDLQIVVIADRDRLQNALDTADRLQA